MSLLSNSAAQYVGRWPVWKTLKVKHCLWLTGIFSYMALAASFKLLSTNNNAIKKEIPSHLKFRLFDMTSENILLFFVYKRPFSAFRKNKPIHSSWSDLSSTMLSSVGWVLPTVVLQRKEALSLHRIVLNFSHIQYIVLQVVYLLIIQLTR